MSSDVKEVVCVIGGCISVFLLTITVFLYFDLKEKTMFVANGYEQVMLPGSETTKWTKIR